MPILQGDMGKKQEITVLAKFIGFFISGDTIKIRVSENSSPLSLIHVHDLLKYFPEVDLSPPERSYID